MAEWRSERIHHCRTAVECTRMWICLVRHPCESLRHETQRVRHSAVGSFWKPLHHVLCMSLHVLPLLCSILPTASYTYVQKKGHAVWAHLEPNQQNASDVFFKSWVRCFVWCSWETKMWEIEWECMVFLSLSLTLPLFPSLSSLYLVSLPTLSPPPLSIHLCSSPPSHPSPECAVCFLNIKLLRFISCHLDKPRTP